MRGAGRGLLCAMLLAWIALAGAAGPAMGAPAAVPGKYAHFRLDIYLSVATTRRLADPAIFEREYARVAGQLAFDEVHIEVYRDRQFATDAQIEAVKRQFAAHGVEVDGGVTLSAGGQDGQYRGLDYALAVDRAECRAAVELAARHFDQVVMDDFFFFNSKSEADIAAKGARSWARYRQDTMRQAAADLVLGPARAANPHVRVILKYPNWYEHYAALGYDLDQEARLFDGVYAGSETRDPDLGDQDLQPYQSYEIIRYFANVRLDAGGGWVDAGRIANLDRYAEQIWDTLLAGAREITLFEWTALAAPGLVAPGARQGWSGAPTSLDWSRMIASYHPSGPHDPGPGLARVAGWSLDKIDRELGWLGRPIGIASYKPFQSAGEDYLHDYLGQVGAPIELGPTFPAGAASILLTRAAAQDPNIVARIEAQLTAGGTVVITSGLLEALQGRGVEDIAQWTPTGAVVAVHDFVASHGVGAGERLSDPATPGPAVLIPEIRFATNESWALVRGVAAARDFPVLLMSRYGKGTLYLLTIPENQGDLYNLPPPVLTQIKRYIQADFPVLIESPPGVSLFAYDNGAFVVQNFRPEREAVTISISGPRRGVRDLASGQALAGAPATTTRAGEGPARARFETILEPHSYRLFRIDAGAVRRSQFRLNAGQ